MKEIEVKNDTRNVPEMSGSLEYELWAVGSEEEETQRPGME